MKMQITVNKVEEPIEQTADRKGRQSYKITTDNGINYYCRPNIGGKLSVGNIVDIVFSPDQHGNKWINKFEPIKDINADMQKIKETFPDSNVPKEYLGGDVSEVVSKPTMSPKDFLIVLQSCCNRQADWTPNQKLKFILDNYFNGVVATHKTLDDGVL
jgi:hypothetical protein